MSKVYVIQISDRMISDCEVDVLKEYVISNAIKAGVDFFNPKTNLDVTYNISTRHTEFQFMWETDK